ncbi:hypothetical protein [Helicobacter suis]|uniref:Uncharacterized protein n=1 Tax=Helicobacter suis TaxID=104628 RepID=A0A6J4CZ86_9HELI|nr:hypothetical protein [Helicobacter suis]BCD70434.1 hypothetical protein SNTW_10790 [Helicobacter suis]
MWKDMSLPERKSAFTHFKAQELVAHLKSQHIRLESGTEFRESL